MKLNNEYNFGVVPTVRTPRSRFLMHKNIRTTFNAAELIPIYINPLVQPGDTFKVKSTMVIRMSTPIYPTMDNLFADLRAFFIPHRITWDHFKEFMGENTTGAWTLTTQYTVPQIKIYTSKISGKTNVKIAKGDNLQYMGIRLGYPSAINTAPTEANSKSSVMALPWRAYALTWNEWYRDENVAAPLNVYKGDSDVSSARGNTDHIWGKYESNNYMTAPLECAPVYKFKDFFNACLPEPQKLAGGAVTLPIGSTAPVIGNGTTIGVTDGTNLAGLIENSSENLVARTSVYGAATGSIVSNSGDMTTNAAIGLVTDATKSGLIADLSNAVAATINAQRVAFAVQRIGELSARAGTRFSEVIDAFFGVKGLMSSVIQRPQYLGGFRIPLQMQQVVQTSSTNTTSPQGNTAAYSLTIDNQHLFTKSFEEWGSLLFCLCVRQEHSYSQGIANFWSKKNKLDFYFPQLAFLGEQPILSKELFADGSANDDTVFGYNERWIEYRTALNINTGAFSPDYAQSLDSWHYGDDYSTLPVLSDSWRRETKDYIDRTLAVQSSVEDQFIMDSRFEFDKTTCMPLRSIPGLLDHF